MQTQAFESTFKIEGSWLFHIMLEKSLMLTQYFQITQDFRHSNLARMQLIGMKIRNCLFLALLSQNRHSENDFQFDLMENLIFKPQYPLNLFLSLSKLSSSFKLQIIDFLKKKNHFSLFCTFPNSNLIKLVNTNIFDIFTNLSTVFP